MKKYILWGVGLCLSFLLYGCGDVGVADSASLQDANTIEIVKENPSIEIGKAEEVEDKGILYSELQKEVAQNAKDSGIAAGNSPFLMPILQNAGKDSVTVQWFTEGESSDNHVKIYDGENVIRTVEAESIKMSRLRGGKTKDNYNDPSIDANIYKHFALVDNLPEYHGYVSERVNYSISSGGLESDIYSLAAAPSAGTGINILLTSDLQIKPMCAANYSKVFETVGHVDAVFCDGDLVDVTDRAYDWFYAPNAFFRVFTGTADDEINGKKYCGAPLLQEAAIYTAVGNHDVMGVLDNTKDLSVQFNNPSTIEHAKELLAAKNESLTKEEEENFIQDHSFNTITYEEIFELPKNSFGNEKYYLVSLGDVGLISLDVSRVWRLPSVGISGKYSELPLSNKNEYGFGDFIFEPVSEGSPQIEFYKAAVNSEEYQNSKIKVTMFHSEAHSLGDNAAPAFTDPVASVIKEPVTGIDVTVYNYPKSKDYIHNVIEPIAESSGTDLLFNAHSHLWNRFKTDSGMNVLQTSNVGNSYGAYLNDNKRSSTPSALNTGDPFYGISSAYNKDDYQERGDLFGLEAISPNISQVPDNGSFVASNSLTVFSILDTQKGSVDSYYFDTENSDSDVVLFDSFNVKR